MDITFPVIHAWKNCLAWHPRWDEHVGSQFGKRRRQCAHIGCRPRNMPCIMHLSALGKQLRGASAVESEVEDDVSEVEDMPILYETM
jgi:hypothetical protein